MSFGARREYFREIRKRYQSGSKKQKSAILNEFCMVCGYSRKYAIRLLKQGERVWKKRPGPKPVYDKIFVEVLFALWQKMQRVSGKKMKRMMRRWLPFFQHEKLNTEIQKKLKRISASHIDRLLASMKKPQGRCTTKWNGFLLPHIPIETRHDASKGPGFIQIDTVAHCGSSLSGVYTNSITVTDIFSMWTENRSIFGKQAESVLNEFVALEKNLPFKLMGYSSDNGNEVLNTKMWNYLNSKGVIITRGRPYQKNDNPHVEQKNNTHVRKLFGYQRYEHRSLVRLMNEIYENYWNPLHNFFIPSFKLIKKERVGARIKKIYDKPQTPYERLLKSKEISAEAKQNLTIKFKSLNPIYLSDQLEEKKREFFKAVQLHRGGFE